MKKFGFISRLIILNLIATSSFNFIQAQQFEWSAIDFTNSRFLGIFEVDGSYFGAVSNGASFKYDSNTIYQLSIYELLFEEEGITLDEIISIPYPENYATISLEYIAETETWLIVQSAVLTHNRQKFRVILYDQNFEFIKEQSIDTTGYPIPFFIDNHNGITYILGSIIGPPDELFFLKYSHSNPHYLPPIEVRQSEPGNTFFITSMNIDKRTNNMLVFYYAGITELDSNLHQEFKLGYNDINTAYHGSALSLETNYFSHSLTEQDLGNGFKSLVFQKYDTLFNILVADTLGIQGQDNYPFITKSLDFRNEEFLVGGHLDGPFAHIDFNKSIKKFYLAKFDEEMNRLWYKEYGGDRAYVLIGLKLLEDGGCLAYGYITDTLTGYWYGYVLNVDAHGEILNSYTLPTQVISIQVVSPGMETLTIHNPDGIIASIEVFDLNGRQIILGDINTNVTEFPMGEFPPGLYPYRLISEGKVIASGKWFKGM